MIRTFIFRATEVLEAGDRSCELKLHVDEDGDVLMAEEVTLGPVEDVPDHWPAD